MAKKKQQEASDAAYHFTLYTAIGDPGRIEPAIREAFRDHTKRFAAQDDSLVLRLEDDSDIVFRIKHQRDDPEFITSQKSGMANYYASVETDLPELQSSVIRQILLFNCIVKITFTLDDIQERTHYIIDCFYTIAKELYGFLLYPDFKLFTANGRLLFSAKGKSELETFTPIANPDLLEVDRPAETPADEERKQRSIARLRKEGVPFIEHLPCEVRESEARIRSLEETLKRAVALFGVAVYSHTMLDEEADRNEALEEFDRLNVPYGIRSCLSPKEQAYIDDPNPDKNTCYQFVWRYEAGYALLWAAGIVEQLPYPNELADIPAIFDILDTCNGLASLLSHGKMRPESELLDAADLTLRYDWACVDARIKDAEAPAKLDEGIVMERHYALNWLIGANGQAEWDDIHPNT